jgi:hypothetical protein
VRVARYIRQHHIGLIALFIALTGTAYAGTQVANISFHSPAAKAKKKKVKRGPAGPQGPAGPAGPQGPPGAPGSSAVQPGGTLASGTTLVGDWAPSANVTSDPTAGQAVSFGGYRLSMRPAIEVIPVGGSSTPHCPGTATAPAAAAGFLCLYITATGGPPTAGDQLIVSSVSTSGNAVVYNTFSNSPSTFGDGRADAWGFNVVYVNNGGSSSQATGVWAVAAP